jgi:hypothetical protein
MIPPAMVMPPMESPNAGAGGAGIFGGSAEVSVDGCAAGSAIVQQPGYAVWG